MDHLLNFSEIEISFIMKQSVVFASFNYVYHLDDQISKYMIKS